MLLGDEGFVFLTRCPTIERYLEGGVEALRDPGLPGADTLAGNVFLVHHLVVVVVIKDRGLARRANIVLNDPIAFRCFGFLILGVGGHLNQGEDGGEQGKLFHNVVFAVIDRVNSIKLE